MLAFAMRLAAAAYKRGQKFRKDYFGSRLIPKTPKGQREVGGIVQEKFNKFKQGTYEVGWAMDALTSLGDKWLARVVKSVTVRIAGSRNAKIYDLFYLAIGLASSRIRRRALVNLVGGEVPGDGEEWAGVYDHVFIANIDYTEKIVQVELAYSIGGAIAELIGKGGALEDIKTPPDNDHLTAVNIWPNFLSTDRNPRLTNTGGRELILAKALGPNPVPAADGISRSTSLYALMSAALTDACTSPPLPSIVQYSATYIDAKKTAVDKLKLNGSEAVSQS